MQKDILKNISLDIRYGFNGKSQQESTGVQILRITDIQKGKVDWNDVPYCKIPNTELKKVFIARG
jgi:type I restriction enzyme S subunit